MTRGRKPTPTRLKLLRGNPGKRKINKKEPKPKLQIPPCPKELTKPAHEEWERVCTELYELGLLSSLDRGALTVYCAAWATLMEAEASLKKKGKVQKIISVTGRVYEKASPWVKIANDARKQMLEAAREFGMTPSSRSRVTVKEREREEDPFRVYEGGKK